MYEVMWGFLLHLYLVDLRERKQGGGGGKGGAEGGRKGWREGGREGERERGGGGGKVNATTLSLVSLAFAS